MTPTLGDIARWLRLVFEPDMVVELRILNVVDNPRYPAFTLSGYFDHDHLDDLARTAFEWTPKAEGCYVTINPVSLDLLARAANRVIKKPKHTTTDGEIVRRIALVFDADPKRPAGVSATNEEKLLAHQRIVSLMSELSVRGWPEPIFADSGNGYHARYKIDLANNDGARELVERVLKAASAMFSDDKMTIDASLSNASRIIKLYGTMSRKGDSTADRPHRWSEVLTAPQEYRVVPTEVLEVFATDYEGTAAQSDRDYDPWLLTATSGAAPEVRARAYVFAAGFPDSIAGENGHGALYRVACELIDGFGLDRSQALAILREWNQAKARPPEDEKQLAHKIDSAIKKHPTPSLKRLNTDQRGPTVRIDSAHDPADHGPVKPPPWPAPLSAEAYHGLAGEIVRIIEPESEADPPAVLVQLLIAFGSMIGRSAHIVLGRARHYTNEFALVVGETSSSRKGTSWEEVSWQAEIADPDWRKHRVIPGLSSGEGLIHSVRDPLETQEPVKEKGKVVSYQMVVTDHGVADKRLLVLETEFGSVLQVLAREGNTLSSVLRTAWDSNRPLGTLTKNPYRATDTHISVIGHITADELMKLLSDCDKANGLLNRFLLLCCKRSKYLPFGGRVDPVAARALGERLGEAARFARTQREIAWCDGSKTVWIAEYTRLTAARPGALGMATSRAEAHAIRLALIYALIDKSRELMPEHIRAGLAVWDYCQRSAAHIFGERTGDKDADKIIDALRNAAGGMLQSEIRRAVFQDHKTSEHVLTKLSKLLAMGMVRSEIVQTGGRSGRRWHATQRSVCVKSVETAESASGFHANHAFHANAADEREVIEL
jgi:hypothetical protein